MLHHHLVQSATIGTVLQLQHLTGAGTPWFNNSFRESIAASTHTKKLRFIEDL